MKNNRTYWLQSAHRLPVSGPIEYKLQKTFCGVLSFINQAQWQGACHATTSILTVLLREQNIEAVPCIGECKIDEGYFDHSWVEVDAKIYDAAIAFPLLENIARAPVFAGLAVDTQQPPSITYGAKSPIGYNAEANMIKDIPLGLYMKQFPNHPEGLLGIAKIIGKAAGINFNTRRAEEAHGHLRWQERA